MYHILEQTYYKILTLCLSTFISKFTMKCQKDQIRGTKNEREENRREGDGLRERKSGREKCMYNLSFS